MRLSPVIAKPFSLPFLMWGMTFRALEKDACTFPPMRSMMPCCASLVGDVLHLDPRQHAEQLAHQVLRASACHGCDIELPGPRLGIGDELLQSIRRHRWIDHQYVVGLGEDRYRGEILEDVVGRPHEQSKDDLAVAPQQDRIAVGSGLCHRIGADHGVAAGAIVDDHGLAKSFTAASRRPDGTMPWCFPLAHRASPSESACSDNSAEQQTPRKKPPARRRSVCASAQCKTSSCCVTCPSRHLPFDGAYRCRWSI